MEKEKCQKSRGEKKLYPIFSKQSKNIYVFWIPRNTQEYISIWNLRVFQKEYLSTQYWINNTTSIAGNTWESRAQAKTELSKDLRPKHETRARRIYYYGDGYVS